MKAEMVSGVTNRF